MREWQELADWLREEFANAGVSIINLTIEDDGMTGTLSLGDTVMVDLNQTILSPPGIFILWDGLALMARRIEYLHGSTSPSVRIICDNARYASRELPMEKVPVVGRVVGRWQRVG